MFYHAGDSQHTQNIQIHKVIGKIEQCVFYFMEKTKRTFLPTQYYTHYHLKTFFGNSYVS